MTIYPDIRTVTTSDGFEITSDCLVEKFNLIIPSGTKTNFTTMPWWLRWFESPIGKSKNASAVHDYLIRTKQDRFFADCVYLYLLTLDLTKYKAIIMFLSLQLFPKIRVKYEVKL